MKIDLHVHSAEISGCANVSAPDAIRLYKEAGYDAIVLTNHYATYNKHRFAAAGLDFMTEYEKCYARAKEAGEMYGVKVFCGYELRFNQNDNDYLVYGMTPEVARDCDRIFAMTPREFSEFAKERGILFYQAHPFRNHMTVVNPSYLFGIEVRNGNPRHDSRNDIAIAWANRFSLHKIGGSDFHQTEDVGCSGIITKNDVNSMDELVEILKKDAYRII
jgi:predicted metal-dependent phosphoesterase TrpH